MLHYTTNLQHNKTALKISAFFISCMLWSIISSLHKKTITVHVPLCVYNYDSQDFCAPDMIAVTLRGQKSDLQAIDYTNLAVHIDGNKIAAHRPACVTVTARDLLLPNNITVIQQKPLNIPITRK